MPATSKVERALAFLEAQLDEDVEEQLQRWRKYVKQHDISKELEDMFVVRIKGGPGSGHFGHAGRPGKRGGSLPGSVAVSRLTGRTAAERQAAAAGKKPAKKTWKYDREGQGNWLITNRGGTRVIAARDGSEETADASMRKLEATLSDLPQEHVKSISRIDLHSGGFPFGTMAYVSDIHEIYIGDRAKEVSPQRWDRALRHEIGHHVHSAVEPFKFARFEEAGLGSNFQSLMRAAGWKADSIKRYKKDRHSGETFAEAYGWFHSDRRGDLADQFPELHDYFQREFGT